jgi:hypothetical protein
MSALLGNLVRWTPTEERIMEEAELCPEGLTLAEVRALDIQKGYPPKDRIYTIQTSNEYALSILEIQGYLVRETVHVARGITRVVWRKPSRETTHSVNDS